jgi:hypothetical protein
MRHALGSYRISGFGKQTAIVAIDSKAFLATVNRRVVGSSPTSGAIPLHIL